MSNLKVVNLRKEPYDVYIGRGSPFGNPYLISKYRTREMVIDWYREWFYKELKNPFFRCKVEKLRGQRLGCYCKPLPCHGDIIVEFLENNDNSKTQLKGGKR